MILRQPLPHTHRRTLARLLAPLVLVAIVGLVDTPAALAKGGPAPAPAPAPASGGGGYTAMPNPGWAAVADMNGDGQPDLVVTSDTYRQVAVLLGNPDGTFRPAINSPTDIYTPGLNHTAVTGDFNGDGRQDVAGVESLPLGGAGYAAFGVELGNGDGTLGALIRDANSQFNIVPQAAADVNGDGKLDLVGPATDTLPPNTAGIQPAGGLGVGVALGNGDGTFRTASTYAVPKYLDGTGARRQAVGDVNRDGRPDIVTSTWLGEIDVLVNRGDGTFGTPGRFAPDSSAFWVTVADLNADGLLDVAFDNQPFARATVLLGAGRRHLPGHGAHRRRCHARRCGGRRLQPRRQGRPVRPVQRRQGGRPALRQRHRPRHRRTRLHQWFRDNAGFGNIVKGDFNNDGKLDVAVPNSGARDTTVTVLLNKTP